MKYNWYKNDNEECDEWMEEEIEDADQMTKPNAAEIIESRREKKKREKMTNGKRQMTKDKWQLIKEEMEKCWENDNQKYEPFDEAIEYRTNADSDRATRNGRGKWLQFVSP